jgi:hypothetical protein
MASAKLSGLALAEFAIGVIFIWSGIKNATLQATATALIQGKNPQTASGVVGGGGNAILTAAVSTGSSGGTPGSGGSIAGYRNPFRNAVLVPNRIDQGVDYTGTGPFYPVGDGVITSTTNSGWPGGGFVCYQLTSGSYAGKYIYVAENVTATVQVGAKVTNGQIIGLIHGGLETGWAQAPGDGYAQSHQAGDFTGANATPEGQSFNAFLISLGMKGGT